MTRRDFMKTMLRTLVLGAVAVGVFRFYRKRQIDSFCAGNGFCSSCAAVNDCVQPQAMSYRHTVEGGRETK